MKLPEPTLKPTVKDVAACSGFSTATVSRVLNNDPKVSAQTREAVRNCMEQLGYRVNPIARSLKTSRSNSIGIIAPEFQNEFFMAVAEGIEAYLRERNYITFICNSREQVSEEVTLTRKLVENHVDGVIIIPASGEGSITEQYDLLAKHQVPFVLVDRLVDGLTADAVLTDNYAGAFSAAAQCLEEGAGKIGFIGGSDALTSAKERFEGYQDALQSHGMDIDRRLLKFGDMHIESGYALTRELLQEHEDLHYLFIINLFMRIGAEKYLAERDIGRDIRIVAFDESPVSPLFRHAWITVRQPLEEIGSQAAELILRRLSGMEPDSPLVCRVPPQMIRHGAVLQDRA